MYWGLRLYFCTCNESLAKKIKVLKLYMPTHASIEKTVEYLTLPPDICGSGYMKTLLLDVVEHVQKLFEDRMISYDY